MRKKAFIPAIIILSLLFSSIVGTQHVKKAKAWPTYKPSAESSIIISVFSPENNKLYNTNALELTLNATAGKNIDNSLISQVCYETDWQTENITVFSYDPQFGREILAQLAYPRTLKNPIRKLLTTVNITGVPEGNHSIKIYVDAWQYSSIEKRDSGFEYYFAYTDLTMASRSATVSFAVDTVPPKIVFSSPKNLTHNSRDVSFNFTVNELFSKCQYSLDGQENVTLAGNLTLEGLLDGAHNLTLYATDAAGNVGSSEMIYFTVDVPEPSIVPVIGVAAIVIGIGLLVYFKKRKR